MVEPNHDFNPPESHGCYAEWCRHYDDHLSPLREEADAGKIDYSAYDEAYDEHLENLHYMVKDQAALLDAAPEMYAALCKAQMVVEEYIETLDDAGDAFALVNWAKEIHDVSQAALNKAKGDTP